jgi:Flp pilus assembly protein TadG
VRAVEACLRDERGQALVEFAIVLPLLLAGLLGILYFGRVLNYNEQATHLVNEAARYAAVNNVPAGATSTLGVWLRNQAVGELGTGKGDVQGAPTVCVTYPSGTAVGNPVHIAMTFKWHWLPIFKIPGASTTITQTADMRLEASPGTFFAAGCS